jgi:hypothetical protein
VGGLVKTRVGIGWLDYNKVELFYPRQEWPNLLDKEVQMGEYVF